MLTTVGVLLHGNVALFEFGVIHEVFGLDRTDDGVPAFDFRVASPDPSVPLRVGNGVSLQVSHTLDECRDVDLVAIPGGKVDGDYPAEILDTVRAVVDNGGRVLTVCSGAFVAGAAGLLDGRRCTTHWRYGDELSRQFPKAKVDTDVLFVDDGPITTSAGTAAGIDASLHLVREAWGPGVANRIARRMVVSPHRDGGQRQFVDAPMPSCSDEGFGALLSWLLEHLDSDISVDDMAERMHMSGRTFARRFVDEVGVSPRRWLTEHRVLAAKNLLESTDAPVEEVARLVGFTSATLLRHHFAASVGVSPLVYRRRFAKSAAVS
ncbi:helix-turn-helix domain-containing protein [Gordonia amicalis]|uniref:Helix-turn-helix domain-containing protein n=1 Tax=Gordonia amicalis TaxID=89053 RepID=A0ABU4DB86_9ACTN|nr:MULTISPECIES: helix-turn-helix domain-containing protein [Gordonia]ATD69941.1 AraC family transcriptional regulator [Gordonia sp. 1D]MDV6306990.1 helix-turn-helix domain-containing protein [Gordonia amicalis]MDV7100126.1 helix-turn-helix domain-containing protein [Gordonia amicalis]MDV7174719.1 helix-turn-helix domain-containing protein [Gordonia amicalis]UOG21169.1 helix-turn-helix domain-containing protein [Gordonia amicalis]